MPAAWPTRGASSPERPSMVLTWTPRVCALPSPRRTSTGPPNSGPDPVSPQGALVLERKQAPGLPLGLPHVHVDVDDAADLAQDLNRPPGVDVLSQHVATH